MLSERPINRDRWHSTLAKAPGEGADMYEGSVENPPPPIGRHCPHCGVPCDEMETANPMLPLCLVDKGTMTPHWRKCPKQAWRWKLQHPEPMGGTR